MSIYILPKQHMIKYNELDFKNFWRKKVTFTGYGTNL